MTHPNKPPLSEELLERADNAIAMYKDSEVMKPFANLVRDLAIALKAAQPTNLQGVDEKRLLHLLSWMAGHTEFALTSPLEIKETARSLRNTAREIIIELFPDSEQAKDVAEWRVKNPDWPNEQQPTKTRGEG